MERRFEVPDIHCEGCRQTIDDALSDADGVHEVHVDQAANLVTVVYDEQRISEDELGDRLADAGFPVHQVSEPGDGADGQPFTALREGVSARDGDVEDGGRAASRYAVLVAAVLAIALAGYTGYVLYPRFDLPAAQGAGLLGLAAAAGIASFFSPCSFPLLIGLLGRQAVQRAEDGERTPRPAVFGAALALGAAVFMLLAGAVIGLGGEALFAGVTFTSTAGIAIRSVVGVLLVVLGLMQAGRLPFSMHVVERAARPLSRRSARLRRERPVTGFAMFGFGYVLAGFG